MKPSLTRIQTGDRVIITARDEFYAFVDGWQGRVTGWNSGHAEVTCQRADGEKILLVPAEQLVISAGVSR